MGQEIFNPVNYGFAWTVDWYTFDRAAGHRLALQARNARIKELKAQGKQAKAFSVLGQLITRGGIGTGHPQIEVIVNCYGINYF